MVREEKFATLQQITNKMAAMATFEDEILSINPEYDLIFSQKDETQRNESPNALEPNTRWGSPYKMKIISKMNEILNAKPIGELPTQHDWEDHESTERETITLMRKLGLEQSIDRAPDEKRTIATVPTSENVIFMKNGRKKMSIFMGDNFFELKSRSEPSFDLDEDAATPEESTTSDFSDDVNLYQPMFDSTLDTENTSLSQDLEGKSPSRVAYKPLDSGVSSDSSKRRSNEGGDSPRRRSSTNEQNGGGGRRSYTLDGSKPQSQRSNRSGSSKSSSNSSSSRSNSNWRNTNGSFSEMRDESIWRINVCKAKEPEKIDNNIEQRVLNQTTTISKETSKPVDVSTCGGTLYKPKDLFMKRKAMLIQQVLAEYQS